MKKFLLSFIAITTLFTASKAQAPDFGFETWANIPFTSVQDPQGWVSLNALTSPLLGSNSQSLFKETVAPYAGSASCKITTIRITGVSIPNPFRPGRNFDTAGFVGIGKINIAGPNVNFGYPSTGRPAVLSYAFKYSPMTGDSAYVYTVLTHWNGTSKDTIAAGKYATGATTTTWTTNNINLIYNPAFNVPADTMYIYASSSIFQKAGAKVGSTLYVDGFAWSGYNSISNIDKFTSSVLIFPNPASSVVNFECSENAGSIEIMDIAGRRVGTYIMSGNKASVSTIDYAKGVYLYSVLNSRKEVINRGKFSVAK